MGFSCLLFLNSSCVKSKEEAELVGQNAENRQAFILRNVSMVAEIQNFMRENQEFILGNQEKIVKQYDGNLYEFLSAVKSEDAQFNRVILQLKRNDRLNQVYYLRNKKVSSEVIISEMKQQENTYTKMLLDDSGDRKTCMALYMQNASDCRLTFLRDVTISVLSAGFGGIGWGLITSFNAGWGLIECQNRAQRTFDYCLGNI